MSFVLFQYLLPFGVFLKRLYLLWNIFVTGYFSVCSSNKVVNLNFLEILALCLSSPMELNLRAFPNAVWNWSTFLCSHCGVFPTIYLCLYLTPNELKPRNGFQGSRARDLETWKEFWNEIEMTRNWEGDSTRQRHSQFWRCFLIPSVWLPLPR